jgi:rhamnopyranosyl-N-acetylglucosaminyl-diphospho-decaprenol beta-1,3/1,4-galactofuranosyltransferase
MNITAIIVTYNRKIDLLRCIRAVLNQIHKVTSIVIIDNYSTDNTFEYIYQNLYDCFKTQIPELNKNTLAKLPPITDINIYYEYEEKNTGGAGGFCRGMEIADQILQTDYIWMMDDDGYPSQECLEKELILYSNFDYILPVSINDVNNEELSWPTRMRNRAFTSNYMQLLQSWGDAMYFGTPFNGALLSKRCFKSVGYVNKFFFIWGDENEYSWRCKKYGIIPITRMDAIFYHPAQKRSHVPIMGGLIKVVYSNSALRMVCFVRNETYISLHYRNKIRILLHLLAYSWLFLITRKLDIKGYKLYLASVADAFKNDFTRHLKYL